jgi:hypothetical protein
MPKRTKDLIPEQRILRIILIIRGQKVILDSDLAALYGVETRRLNEQVRRNMDKFPEDFMFQLTKEEFANLKSQIAASSSGWGGRRKTPLVFTEHGALQAANVLNSEQADKMRERHGGRILTINYWRRSKCSSSHARYAISS